MRASPASAEVARQRLGIGPGPIITGPDQPIIGHDNTSRRRRWRYRQTLKQLGAQPLLELWRD